MTVKVKNTGEKMSKSDNEETLIQIFVKQMLVTRIFAASYIGRFHVDCLKSYRDLVKIYKEESDLTDVVEVVKKRIDNFYHGSIWSAITIGSDTTEAPSGHCLWVELQNVPFGDYWFMIQDVMFTDMGEVVIKLKIIRNFESKLSNNILKDGSFICVEIGNNILSFFKEIITWHNVKESSKFIFVLLMTVVTVILQSLQYLGDYSIRFFREFNNLIKVCTPILLGVLDLISKVIGGLYILIASMWRGRGFPPPPQLSTRVPHQALKAIKQPHYQKRSYY